MNVSILFTILLLPRAMMAFPFLKSIPQSTRNLNVKKIARAMVSDTIFALSSGPMTKCGVSVIRVSGPAAKHCLTQMIPKQKFPEARIASLRRLICPKTRSTLDSALVLWFPSPRSFTGEDVVEFHVHGSRAVILGMFEAFEFLDNTSASQRVAMRPAERGEFTRRAFDNGRMDLTEVEGLSDLLAADTTEQRKQALRQMEGHLRVQFEKWREELLVCLAHTEAVIDFGDDDREEDVSDKSFKALIPRVQKLWQQLTKVLEDGRRGELVRDGLRVALVGPPNAGKSSLLNALARRPAAIVSPIAGTTRDVVEVRLDLGGVPCILSDTAGLRSQPADTPSAITSMTANPIDAIELEGMRRAKEVFRRADIRVFVADSSDPASLQNAEKMFQELIQEESQDIDEDARRSKERQQLFVLNKQDISSHSKDIFPDDKTVHSSGSSTSISPSRMLSISCVTGEGIAALETTLADTVKAILVGTDKKGGLGEEEEGVLITRERHRRHVMSCLGHLETFLGSQGVKLQRYRDSLQSVNNKNEDENDSGNEEEDEEDGETSQLLLDIAAEELRLAMQDLGRVTGRVDVEELLDVIFRDFCIGK